MWSVFYFIVPAHSIVQLVSLFHFQVSTLFLSSLPNFSFSLQVCDFGLLLGFIILVLYSYITNLYSLVVRLQVFK